MFIDKVIFDPRCDDTFFKTQKAKFENKFGLKGKISKSRLYYFKPISINISD
jgi:hypothetical protein